MRENEPVETIHVYLVREEEEPAVIDSSVQDTAKRDTQPLVPAPYPTHLQLVPYLLISAHLLIVLIAVSLQVYTLLTETATITIIPTSYRITTHLNFTPTYSRLLSPVTLVHHTTVPATGKGHQDATRASGTITFYNASEQ